MPINRVEASELLTALASPFRLKLLEALIASDRPLGIDELFDLTPGAPMSYQGRFHHLKILRRADLVKSHLINGKRVSMQPNMPLLRSLLDFFSELL